MGQLSHRTNEEWITELRRHRVQGEVADSGVVGELRSFLRGALTRTMSARDHFVLAELDDLVQDALVRILEGLERFRGESRFTTWATAIALRVAFSSLRRRRHDERTLEEPDLQTEVDPDCPDDPINSVVRGSLVRALHTAIQDALTPKQREAVLGELDGTPTVVLAERLKTNTNALYKLHHDARKRLKVALIEAGFEPDDIRRELACSGGAS